MLVNSLTISQTAKMTAEMKFKEMAIISIVTQLLTGIIGLYLAYCGWGVWALVFQQLSSSVARLLMMELFLNGIPNGSFLRFLSYICFRMVLKSYAQV